MFTRWANNCIINFVRRNLSKTLAKTVKFGTVLDASFFNIPAENDTNMCIGKTLLALCSSIAY